MHENKKKTALVIIQDVSMVKQFEKNKQMNRFKTIYFTSMAHDLRTPINQVTSCL